MIIPVSGVDSLDDYVLRRKTLDEFRPEVCPSCKKEKTFWRHGKYQRTVFDGGKSETVRVNRFRCGSCSLVVSCIFSFITPYTRFASSLVSTAIENFSNSNMSYSQQASELTNLASDSLSKPSPSQIFRWVDLVSCRAESLLFDLQKLLLMRDSMALIKNFAAVDIPNWCRARSKEKKERLKKLGELVQMARVAYSCKSGAMLKLHASFFCFVESLQAIFCGRLIRLPTAHNLQPRLF